jgi:hypothetical protein
LLPDWRWEALEKKDDGLYYGRVRSPNTYENWEYGYVSREQLEGALAYRVDEEFEDYEPVFPDVSNYQLSKVCETELAAVDDELEGEYRSNE